MRGRTNIPERPNAIINGKVKNFVVGGSKINVGDFVSYSSGFNISNLGSNYNDIIPEEIIVNDEVKIVRIKEFNSSSTSFVNSKIAIYKNGSEIYSITSTFSFEWYVNRSFVCLSNRKVICIEGLNKLSVYQINSEYTEIVKIKEINYSDGVLQMIIPFGDEFLIYNRTSTSEFDGLFQYCSLTELNELNVIKETEMSIGASSNYYVFENEVGKKFICLIKGSIKNFEISNDGTVLLSSENTNVVPELSILNFKVNLTDNICYLVSYSTISSPISHTILFFKKNMNGDWEYKFQNEHYLESSSTYPNYKRTSCIMFVKGTTENDIIGLCGTIKFLVSNSYPSKSSSYANNLKEYFYGVILACKFEYTESGLIKSGEWFEVNRLEEYVLSSNYYYPSYYTFERGYYDCYLGKEHETSLVKISVTSVKERIKFKYIISDNKISVNDDKVYPYNGTALGFAKTGGESGSVIQVYVPN